MNATPPAWLSKLSGLNAESALAAGLGQSKLLSGALAASHALHDRLRGWIQGSAIAKHIDVLALGSVCLLFFASPFVGTGVNAALVLLALAMVVFRLLFQPDTRARFGSIDALVLALIGMHVAATGFSAFLVPSLKGLAKMLIYWSAYFCFRQTLQTSKARFWVLAALFAAGALESTYGIYQWIIGVEPLANWEDPEALNPLTRVYSTLMNPNLLAAYLLPIFPLAVVAGLQWKSPARFLALATALTAPVCLWFTYSRGALIGLFASVAVFLLMGGTLAWPRIRQDKRVKWVVGGGLLGLFALLGLRIATSPALQERIASIFTLRGHSSNSFRMNVWTGVLSMIHDNWLIGVGVGNAAFRKMYSLYMVSGFEALGAYNIFLEVLAELGVFGLAAFVALSLAVLARNLYTFWAAESQHRWWAAAIASGLVGTYAMGMFDTVFYRPAVQLQFWLLVALTVALSPRPPAPASADAQRPPQNG